MSNVQRLHQELRIAQAVTKNAAAEFEKHRHDKDCGTQQWKTYMRASRVSTAAFDRWMEARNRERGYAGWREQVIEDAIIEDAS